MTPDRPADLARFESIAMPTGHRHARVWVAGLTALILILVSGCATIGPTHPPLVPTRYQTRTGPFTVYTDFALAAEDAPVHQLRALERQLEATLGTRVDEAQIDPIEVYILGDRKAFAHFLTFHYPELPTRRAFFLAQGPRRVVYTYSGDRLEEDLRHEATHALLHAAVSNLPLWLDEGLAEYFEVCDRPNGLNREHLERLPADLADGWIPDLPRLETLTDVRQMTPRDYREAWAWVHYLLHDSNPTRAALLGYLADLRSGARPQPLSSRLPAQAEAGLLAHLSRLQQSPHPSAREYPIAQVVPARGPTLRLQNHAPLHVTAPPAVELEIVGAGRSAAIATPPAPNASRRGLLGRIRDLFSDRDR